MKYTITISEKVRDFVNNMSWEELIDHASCPNFSPENAPEREYGSVFFHPDTHDSLKKKITNYRSKCKIPPLITTDMEAGPGNMITDGTRFPSLMACGQCNDENLAYEMGRIAALEGREAGFNWSLAPCVDIARVEENPIVSVRSVGSDTNTVIKMSKAYIKGMQENGMAATAKHFPGDGFSSYDQHLTTTVNPLSKEDWYRESGKVFKEIIDDGVMTVMPGHISLPAFDVEDEYLKCCPPATLSKKLMVDLLRNELGFEGMIVSDAVNMGGMANFMNYYDACATFWENGGDCLLFAKMDSVFYSEMKKRIDSGMISLDTLKDRAARIMALKEQMGILDGEERVSTESLDYEKHQQTAKAVAAGAVEIVRDRAGIIPVKPTGKTKILHLIISNSYESHKSFIDYFSQRLTDISGECKVIVDPGPDGAFSEIQNNNYDLVVCSTGCQVAYGVSSVRLHGPVARNMMQGWMRLGTPVIFVNHFHPFIQNEFDATMDTLINTYRSTKHSIDAVMKTIFQAE